MKLFTNDEVAWESYKNKDKYYLNSICHDHPHRLCGNWCSLFYPAKENGEVKYVILGCKGTDKRLYVDEVI